MPTILWCFVSCSVLRFWCCCVLTPYVTQRYPNSKYMPHMDALEYLFTAYMAKIQVIRNNRSESKMLTILDNSFVWTRWFTKLLLWLPSCWLQPHHSRHVFLDASHLIFITKFQVRCKVWDTSAWPLRVTVFVQAQATLHATNTLKRYQTLRHFKHLEAWKIGRTKVEAFTWRCSA